MNTPGNAESHFADLLSVNARDARPLPRLDATLARHLLDRTADVPFFAHSYALIHNLDHGIATTSDLLDFAYVNELHGLCLHLNDGGSSAVGRMTPDERAAFRRRLEDLKLSLHLEISSSEASEVERAKDCALALGVTNVRFYARYAGPLSEVIEHVYADTCHAAEIANRYDLHFDYEQHEDLRAAEIADILRRVGDSRVNALFDYTNSLNAYEEPLDALRTLAPYIRQAHVKGGRKIVEPDGWGQLGVVQGTADDELPGNRMFFELLMLGEERPQVICYALEQEVGYYAPPFRSDDPAADPVIAYREPSETPLDASRPLERLLVDEKRWAVQQVRWNRSIVSQMRDICFAALPTI